MHNQIVLPQIMSKSNDMQNNPQNKKTSLVGLKRTQEIVGSFLCYSRVADSFPLVQLVFVSSEKHNSTKETNKAINLCLDYLATFVNGKIRCTSFDMVL